VRFRSAARRLGEDEMGANGSVAGGARRLEAGLAVCLRFCVIAALVLPAAVLAQPVPAPAQDLPFDDRPPDRWVFAVTPYLWALSLNGDATVRGFEAPVDVGFGDIFDNLNFGAMVDAEARRGRIGGFVNTVYGSIGGDSTAGPLTVDTDVKTLWVGFGLFYRVGTWSLDPGAPRPRYSVTVDPYVGGRYTYLDVDLDVQGGRDFGRSRDWVDPIVGVRTIWTFGDRWNLVAAGDVGGFGVGSDFAWQATGLIGYRVGLFAERDANLFAGYRALDQDYSDGSGRNRFAWDVTAHGPVIGVAIRF